MPRSSTRSAADTATVTAALGVLPNWNLADLYDGIDSPAVATDLKRVDAEAEGFAKNYEGTVAGLSGPALAAAIVAYERMQDTLGRLMSFGGLAFAGAMDDSKVAQFYQTLQERVNAASVRLLFFTLELNRIDDADLDAKLRTPALAHYAAWLRDVRAFRPHQLSDEIEKLLHEKYVAGRAAWGRLFDETVTDLRFPVGGKDLTIAEAMHLMFDPDRARRQEGSESVATVLGGAARTFALITNTLAKDKEIEDRWRNFARPISARNLSNFVEDEVVDALVHAVKESYPSLSHRYYRMKARWLGLDKLEYWDRNAPLPGAPQRNIPWTEARQIVLDSYRAFSPKLAVIGERFFTERWIDAAPRPGKDSGAFSHPTVPSAHPYILMNYMGNARDVMTLAHELGHGVHQVLAARQGALMADTPLTLAETASVFGEMLTFRKLLASERDPATRKALLARKVEDMLNTAIRQIAFCEFERRVHDERRAGELLPERLNAIWLEIQVESLGPAFDWQPGYGTYWSSIPHFIHTPFYVYAYAFGDCLVNSLYAAYQAAPEGFAEKYLDMLSAGGTLRHHELLKPFGLDAREPAFWDKGLGVLRGFIDELEALG
ncbi:MAG TPA: M3 family oligoendopeptidase [Aliidongia sp.]|uniref:M3 family oligoendopeptidase n=1 Tax=Aliidongia sp. TaxID=1914230 RepID=UPI002DDD6A01|nr:M3 family oligoendopeptidase [Aliidongia sp.]HEV2677746.1 M3 family oligoendopeptidase [Aliidongia sp.]